MRHSPAAALRQNPNLSASALEALHSPSSSSSIRLDTVEVRARDLERERTRDRMRGLELEREGKNTESKNEPAGEETSFPFMLRSPASETERYRLQAKTADLRRDEAERKCTKLREQLAGAEAKLYVLQNQKEQQDLQLAGVEERIQTLNKLRDAATHDKFQQDRDIVRMRAELDACKAGSVKKEAEVTLLQQELTRKDKKATEDEIALRREIAEVCWAVP